ncbi:helix-turn-helix domain-containing protein [Paraburkholderia terrae]|uniref:helix-turn-helix domain-containing protein n=1 Tax=Paraburkholderia terrae TaxID=311230 RepID=UPI00296ADB1C|nr:helix-turn-helix domain-containing protein [Paraburkholderia terrae]MDW3660218.1 helix-turn-helix domain-containing protein [Paraburkholderia terrae]
MNTSHDDAVTATAEAVGSLAFSLQTALDTLSGAVLEGTDSVTNLALDLVRASTGVSTSAVLRRTQGEWVPQSALGSESSQFLESGIEDLLKDDSKLSSGSYGCFVPLSPGTEAIFLPGFIPTDAQLDHLRLLASAFTLASSAASRGRAVVAALDEISGLQSVVRETLSARELNQVLSCATHETLRLLSSNICGVFLREGDEVVMRSCVGNLRVETAQLRMKKGRGVAGRVFETGEAVRVDEYIRDNTISPDYMDLARLEHAYSALAAPLKVHDEVVGVLEVWRRRKSTFSDRDVRRIKALADLVAIAIHNAKLNETQQLAVEQLATANRQLKNQNSAFGQSAEIQQSMIGAILAGEGLDGIARTIGRYSDADVAIVTDEMQPMTTCPVSPKIAALLPAIATVLHKPQDSQSDRRACLDDVWIRAQPIAVSGEKVGWACIVSNTEPGEIADMALGSGVMACALSYLESRAAMLARAEVSSEILWDLLEGEPKVRLAAVARAKGLRIELTGPHRILHCSLEQLDVLAHADGWDAGAAERSRRVALDYCTRGLETAGLRLMTVRGNLVIALISGKTSEEIRRVLDAIRENLAGRVAGFSPVWGVSSISGGSGDFRAAHREAAIALLAATKFCDEKVAISDELGVLGLLLSIRHDSDVEGLVGAILGDAVEYDRRHNHALAKTLRTYFDADCSLQSTASALHVHQKTVRYRLNQFEQLSGMDLRKHENRMMVDIALRMQMIRRESAELPS